MITLKYGEGRFPPGQMEDAINLAQAFISHQMNCETCKVIMMEGDEVARTRALCDEGLNIFTGVGLAICVGVGKAIMEAKANSVVIDELVSH